MTSNDTPPNDANGLPTLKSDSGAFETPDEIGRYRVLDMLGEGGIAVVYLAEQTEPVQRRVAVKMIKLGMDTRQVVARFESERQALAVMDHPGIAKVFDAGVTDTGRPYFAMEHVQGVPITEYCNSQRLTTQQRIGLIIAVCRAVQHAHQKGVIHRDLKPSNILVGVRDDMPAAKVIDFGIAKALGPGLAGSDVVTRLGQFLGTPRYMSPEQADGAGLDVDTRTDVYSLGVVLYELLTDVPPLDLAEVPDHSMHEAIRNAEPATPSSRLKKLGDSIDTIARDRRTEPHVLRRVCKGDLDWIVMKAMHKDRVQRYDTVNAMAMDLERFLDHRPVLARPPSTWYAASRFVRRNRAAVTVAALAVVGLLIAVALTTSALIRARQAERAVTVEAETSRQVSDFLVGLFQVSDPDRSRGETVTAREMLDRGADSIDADLGGQPEVRATLMVTMGTVYHQLSLYAEAERLFTDALAVQETLHGAGSLPVAATLNRLGLVLTDQGRFEDAGRLLRHALGIRRQALDQDHVEVARNLNDLGWVVQQQGDYGAAAALYEEALDVNRALFGDEHLETADVLNRLAVLRLRMGEPEQAEPLRREALAIHRKVLGDEHTLVAQDLNNLGSLLYDRGDYTEAEAAYREALTLRRRMLGTHADVATTMNNLGLLLWAKGDHAAARTMYVDVLAMRRDLLGNRHPAIGGSLNDLGVLHRDMGDFDTAVAYLREAMALFDDILGPNHPNSAVIRTNLADALSETGQTAEAMDLLTAALVTLDEKLPTGHWRTAVARNVLGGVHAALEEYGTAERLLLDTLPVIRAAKGEQAPYTRAARQRLIRLYRRWGKPDLAGQYEQP